jgi:hypothetical protein
MAAAAITPRLSETAFIPASFPGVSFTVFLLSNVLCKFIYGFAESGIGFQGQSEQFRDARHTLQVIHCTKNLREIPESKALIYIGQQYLVPIGVKNGTLNVRKSRPHREAFLQCRYDSSRLCRDDRCQFSLRNIGKRTIGLVNLWVSFFCSTAIVPLATIMKLRKGEKAKPDVLVQTAYINAYLLVMLATILFTR